MSKEQRMTASFAKWDVELQCRDMNAVQVWVKENAIDKNKYDPVSGD